MTTRVERSAARCIESRRLVADTNMLVALSWRVRNGWIGIRGGSGAPRGAGLPHWPLDELERLVQDKVSRGALFLLYDDKYWASPATGQRRCRVCSDTISRGNECEISVPRGYVYAHLACHQLWWRASEAFRNNQVNARPLHDAVDARSEAQPRRTVGGTSDSPRQIQ